MNGEILKSRLLKLEPSLAEIARKLNVKPQSLSQALTASDIKTGFIEKLAVIYDRPISYFFDEQIKIDDHSRKDNHSAQGFSASTHYEGCDASIVSKLQIAEDRINLLEAQLKDKDEVIRSKNEIIELLKSKQ